MRTEDAFVNEGIKLKCIRERKIYNENILNDTIYGPCNNNNIYVYSLPFRMTATKYIPFGTAGVDWMF